MRLRTLAFALTLALLLVACGESHTPEMDASVIVFDATFPDTGPDASATNNVGEPCRGDMDCTGAADTCVSDLPGGYCSAICAGDEDCPTGASCVQVDRTTSLCLDGCDPGATDQCRSGYGCATGIGAPVCWPGCEDDTDCDEGTTCNPDGGRIAEGRCFTEGSAIGDACGDSSQCPADGFCFDADFGFPGGYCAGFGCELESGTGCAGDGVCLPGFRGGLCFDGCVEDDDCRTGYECRGTLGFPERRSCQPRFTEPGDLGEACSQDQVACAGGLCITEGSSGWPGSVCVAEDCDPAASPSDCPTGGVCLETATGFGVCISSCGTGTDCRPGYDCRRVDPEDAESPLACQPGCDDSTVCANEGFVCNTGTGLCTEPFEEDSLGDACMGFDAAGEPDCVGGRCLTEESTGWPAGTCAYPGCRLSGEGPTMACPSGSVCVDDANGDPELGVCVTACTADGAPCRAGYGCLPVDPEVADGPRACQPACAADSCSGGRACSTETGRCE